MNAEEKLLEARVNDAFESASEYKEKFVGFLDPHEAALANRISQRSLQNASFDGCSYELFGGYDCAERVFLGVFPPYFEKNHEDFPIIAVHFEWRFAKLSHRDFLGALLSLGIDKTKLGDIVVCENECTVFLEKKVSPFVLNNITKVGSAGVKCEITDGTKVAREENFKEIKTTIASKRLDCVVAALTGISRSAANEIINKELVSLNFEITGDSTKNVEEPSTVSIRGHGRFAVISCGPETRKGRLRFYAKKYL